MDILLASVILVIAAKTLVVTAVVRVMGHSMKTSLVVSAIEPCIFLLFFLRHWSISFLVCVDPAMGMANYVTKMNPLAGRHVSGTDW